MYVDVTDSNRKKINPQADWQQNDETANNYVKNRPGGYEALTEILPETTLNFTSRQLTLTDCPPIEVGKTYTVTFYRSNTDPIEYELVGKEANIGSAYRYIGNEAHTWGGTNTGEPFIIYSYENSTAIVTYIFISSSETLPCTYNIKIKAVAPIKIPEKYLDIKNTNIVNGSKTGSLRTVGSSKEGSGYEIGNYAFAEGIGTTASGTNSHAEGESTTASGSNSHAEGQDTIASSNYQHVQGRYNIEDSNNIYADIIGNGNRILNTPSNAATVDWQGNAWYAGDVYVGSTSGTNKDEGSKKLATEEYVNSAISSSEGSNVQADWQQNDETANDYVKNRPGGYEEILENTLSEVNFTGTNFSLDMALVLGDTYKVTFDGVEYVSTAKQDSGYPIFIGNTNYTWHGTITYDPFCIHQVTNTCAINCDPGDHTVKVDKINIAKIDKKYLDIKNTNIINGSTEGSLRTIGSAKENSSYTMGEYAFAEGYYTKASGAYSHAEGNNTTASSEDSHAEG